MAARKGSLAGLWFPVALGVLLLLALPGALLLLLTLFGKQAAVNGWLQDRFGLSYHVALPAWGGVLLLLVPVLLVLLYFLKLRRRPLQVPSTFLWRKSIEDLHVNTLFQWLRDNVLLLLQLLAMLLLLYAVLAVRVHGDTTSGKHYILVLDNSASMAATDVAPSRLEAAKEEALREIDAHGENDSGMVIAFNSRASILQPYTTSRALLRAAVRRIRQTNRPTRLDEALGLADSLANPRKSTMNQASLPENVDPNQARTIVDVKLEAVAAEVHLFSDGRFPDVHAFAAGNLDLNYHRIGRPGADNVDNLGIVTVNAVRDEQDSGRLRVLVRVLNFRAAPAAARVELTWRVQGEEEFRLLPDQTRALPGRTLRPGDADAGPPPADVPGAGEFTFELENVPDGAAVVLHARLLDHRDSFALDDEAWFVVDVVRKARVLLVTAGNEVLSDFFDQEATAKVARVQYLTPAELKDDGKYRRPARAGAWDLVVFDRCAPDKVDDLPLGNTFFIDAVPPPWRRAALPPLKETMIRNPAGSHPLMRHLTALDQIAFSGAFRFDLKDPRVPVGTPRLLETDGENAVLFLLARRSFGDLVLAFPLVNARGEWATTWNLKLSLPVFLRNVLYTLGNVRDATARENVSPGEVVSLRPDVALTQVSVTDPGGGRAKVTRGARGDFPYNDTECGGVYEADWPGGRRAFAVNLLDTDESNVQPRDEVQLGASRLTAGRVHRETYETWKWAVLAALGLLVLEWALHQRRIFF